MFKILMQARFDMLQCDELTNNKIQRDYREYLIGKIEEIAAEYSQTMKMSTEEMQAVVMGIDAPERLRMEMIMDMED